MGGRAAGGASRGTVGAGCGGKARPKRQDVTGLTYGERRERVNLGNVEVSPHDAAKNCTNCNFFTAGAANDCGTCTLVKGPINPTGYCNSWAIKV